MKGRQNNPLDDCGNSLNFPHSEEAEAAVISALIVESNAIHRVVDILTPEMFYNGEYSDIYRSIIKLYDKNIPIDLVSITDQVIRDGMRVEYSRMAELAGIVSSDRNIENHALYVKQKFVQRQMLMFALKLKEKSMDDMNDPGDTLDYASKEIDSIMAGAVSSDNTYNISEAAESSYLEAIRRNTAYLSGYHAGIPTGFKTLDKYTGGFRPGQLVVIAARPAMGKTAIMIHSSKTAGKDYHPVIFSLEMTAKSLADRLILSESEISSERFKNGSINEDEKSQIYEAFKRVSNYNITINDDPDMTIRQIKSKALQLQKLGQCDIIFIDYLQLINMRSDNRNYNREQEVSQVSRQCKILAKELDIPVVLLSQLNRSCETRADKRPLLSDLRESGAIEQDADIVIFIHRPEYYDDSEERGKGILIVAKHREGPTGDIDFYYDTTLTKISDTNNFNRPF